MNHFISYLPSYPRNTLRVFLSLLGHTTACTYVILYERLYLQLLKGWLRISASQPQHGLTYGNSSESTVISPLVKRASKCLPRNSVSPTTSFKHSGDGCIRIRLGYAAGLSPYLSHVVPSRVSVTHKCTRNQGLSSGLEGLPLFQETIAQVPMDTVMFIHYINR